MTTTIGQWTASRTTRRSAAALGFLSLDGTSCSGPGGNPDRAQSAQCDHGFLCGSYVDGDGNLSQAEWDNAFKAADTNGDGEISAKEEEIFRAYLDPWRLGGPRSRGRIDVAAYSAVSCDKNLER